MKKYDKYIDKEKLKASINLPLIWDFKNENHFRKMLEITKLFKLDWLLVKSSILVNEEKEFLEYMELLPVEKIKFIKKKKTINVELLIKGEFIEEVIKICAVFNTTCFVSNINYTYITSNCIQKLNEVDSDVSFIYNDIDNNIIIFDYNIYDINYIEKEIIKILKQTNCHNVLSLKAVSSFISHTAFLL